MNSELFRLEIEEFERVDGGTDIVLILGGTMDGERVGFQVDVKDTGAWPGTAVRAGVVFPARARSATGG